MSDLVNLADNTIRNHIPIDTGELRDQDRYQQISPDLLTAEVGIRNITHYGRKHTPIDAAELADLLNIGTGQRTQKNVRGFGRSYRKGQFKRKTTGWIEDAQAEFDSAFGAIE